MTAITGKKQSNIRGGDSNGSSVLFLTHNQGADNFKFVHLYHVAFDEKYRHRAAMAGRTGNDRRQSENEPGRQENQSRHHQ
jgi:hypothetical protein